MTMHNGGSPSDLEREAEASRNRLSGTLDELRDRMTPGQVMDEVLSYAKGSGASFLHSLAEAARANPIPTILIGAGCAMFLTSSAQSHSRGHHPSRLARDRMDRYDERMPGYDSGSTMDHVGERVSGASHAMRQGASRAMGAVSETAGDAGRSVRSAAEGVKGSMSSAAESVKSGMQGAAESVRSGMQGATEGMASTAEGVSESMRSTASNLSQRASETYDTYSRELGESATAASEYAKQQADWARRQVRRGWSALEEQPIVLATIGLAIGAALGAALPSTRRENELLGETSDRVKQAAAEMAGEQYEKAKSVAGSAAEAIAKEAEEKGLSAQSIREAARDVGERVKSVATAAGEAVKGDGGSKPEEKPRFESTPQGSASDFSSARHGSTPSSTRKPGSFD